MAVSTHSRLKAAGTARAFGLFVDAVSTHSRLKAAGPFPKDCSDQKAVSTHSRLKAAGKMCRLGFCVHACFNTQPPEGGWSVSMQLLLFRQGFNTQPPEGGWW